MKTVWAIIEYKGWGLGLRVGVGVGGGVISGVALWWNTHTHNR